MVKFFNLAELAQGGSVTSGATQSSLYCKGHNFSTNLRLKKTHYQSQFNHFRCEEVQTLDFHSLYPLSGTLKVSFLILWRLK